jgi:FkbM family methyltransferase
MGDAFTTTSSTKAADYMVIVNSHVAVLDVQHDRVLSRWVEQSGSVDAYDPRIRGVFAPMIPTGGWVVDAGAFLGSHTVPYAERVGAKGRVLAFEPMPHHLECLQFNTKHLPNVQVIPCALYSELCTLWMVPNKINAGASVVGSADDPDAVEVQAIALDDCRFSRLDFIKLDVEGLALRVLQGAKRTLQSHRPIVLTEVGDNLELFGDSTEDLIEYMQAQNYEIDFVPQQDAWDVLFRPKE